MYLKRFEIENVKCFDSVSLHFPNNDGDYSGWVVLLGGNGTGKTTLLQAIALTLIGPLAGQRLLQPRGWIAPDQGYGELKAEIVRTDQDSQVTGQPRKQPFVARFAVTGDQPIELDDQPYDQPQLVQLEQKGTTRKALAGGPYSARRPGWFCCGYGPFRRLSGGDSAEAKLVYSQGREARFATLFRESVALTMCQDWLTQLYARSVDPGNPDRDRSRPNFEAVRRVIDLLLPGGVRIESVDTANVYFRTVGGSKVTIPDLSDGYRSFLSLAVDMLRHMFESDADFAARVVETLDGPAVTTEGVVLIDEADAHLHPIWQRDIGKRLRSVFPKVQFIVSTHSPFVAQSASDDGLIVLRPGEGGRVGCVQPVKSVIGWKAEAILTSPLFGLSGTRDQETEELIEEHARLVGKREWGTLSPKDQTRLAKLEVELGDRLTAPGDTPAERAAKADMDAYIQKVLAEVEVAE